MPKSFMARLFGGSAALSAAAGLATAAAFPPWGVWPLALAGLIPLCLTCLRRGPLASAGAGLAFGLALGLGQMYWIMVVLTVYGGLSQPLALLLLVLMQLYLALFPACFAALASGFRRAGLSPLFCAPLLWAGTEWLRGTLFTGFPWLPLGGALVPAPPLIQSAEIWGAGGLSAAVVLVNMLLARFLLPFTAGERARGREVAALGLAVIILAGGWFWGRGRAAQVRRAAAVAPHLAVSVVQGNLGLARLWNPALRMDNIRRQARLTRRAGEKQAKRPWLVVWPESAAPFYFLHQARPTQAVLDLAREEGAYLLAGSMGSVRRDGEVKPANRAWLVGPDGRPREYYDKVHLVPFGEYVPLGEYLPFIKAVAAAASDFAPGVRGHTLDAGGARLGPLICYESIFAELAREQRRKGAVLMVNQTNDAWFGRTGASSQHMSHLALRAVENRMACARAANTGVSGFVLPDGSMTQLIGLFKAGVQTRSLPLLKMDTFYTRRGDVVGPWGLVVCLAAALLVWGVGRFRNKEARDV